MIKYDCNYRNEIFVFISKFYFLNSQQEMNLPLPNPNHHSAKRLSLIQQIKTYQEKINQYQLLQKQIQQLATFTQSNSNINSPFRFNTQTDSKSSTIEIGLTKKGSTKSILQRKSIELKAKPKEISKFQIAKQQKKGNSNLKIKIYQLQKKLSKLNKQHNEKFSQFTAFRREQESIQASSKQIMRLCQVQNQHTQQFYQNALKIDRQLQIMAKKTQQCKKQYQFNYRHLTNYQFEQQRLLDQIQRAQNTLKKEITQIVNENEQQESCITGQNNQFQQEFSYIKQESILDLSDSKISPLKAQKQNFFNIQGNIYHVVDSNQSIQSDLKNEEQLFNVKFKNQSKQKQNFIKSYQGQQNNSQNQLKVMQMQIIQKLKDAVQTLQQHNNQLSNTIFNQNSQLQSIKALIKHKKVTFQIAQEKLKSYQKFIKRQQTTFSSISRQLQQNRKLLSHKEGQRGQIRGKIGSKTEQVKMIRLINNAIRRDLQNIKQKCGCLKVYKEIIINSRGQEETHV